MRTSVPTDGDSRLATTQGGGRASRPVQDAGPTDVGYPTATSPSPVAVVSAVHHRTSSGTARPATISNDSVNSGPTTSDRASCDSPALLVALTLRNSNWSAGTCGTWVSSSRNPAATISR